MKYYSASTIFKYTWDQLAVGFWSRYPNPQRLQIFTMSLFKYNFVLWLYLFIMYLVFDVLELVSKELLTHVLSEDVIYQTVSNGKLITKKLLTKTNSIPKWGERFVSGPTYVYVVEESVVDPQLKTLTTYTRNIGYTSLMTVEEKCVYKLHEENNEWTECQRQAFITSNIRGLSYALQTFGLERFKMNANKSVKGFNHALNMLHHHLPSNTPSNKHSLKDTAEAAKKLASTVVTATN